jgi:hypothetical protein
MFSEVDNSCTREEELPMEPVAVIWYSLFWKFRIFIEFDIIQGTLVVWSGGTALDFTLELSVGTKTILTPHFCFISTSKQMSN